MMSGMEVSELANTFWKSAMANTGGAKDGTACGTWTGTHHAGHAPQEPPPTSLRPLPEILWIGMKWVKVRKLLF